MLRGFREQFRTRRSGTEFSHGYDPFDDWVRASMGVSVGPGAMAWTVMPSGPRVREVSSEKRLVA